MAQSFISSLSLFDDIIDFQGLYTCINTLSFLVPSLLRINNPQVGFSLELFWLVVFLHLPVLVGAKLQCYTLATGWGIEFDLNGRGSDLTLLMHLCSSRLVETPRRVRWCLHRRRRLRPFCSRRRYTQHQAFVSH